jgi:hypothetical protein
VILCSEKRDIINDAVHGMLWPWCYKAQSSEESKQSKEKVFFLLCFNPKTKASPSFETQGNITPNTWQHTPEDSNLQQRCCENEIQNISLSHLQEHEPISSSHLHTTSMPQ